jgi:hypothetical protein
MSDENASLTVAYCLQNAPIVYWGELVDIEAADTKKDDRTIYLSKAMVMVMQQDKDTRSLQTAWSKPVACGSNSLVAIDPSTVPGICVYHPDEEQMAAYKTEYTQAHTRLTLLR